MAARMKETDSLPWRGIFAIPVTPFDSDQSLDLSSLERQVEFCLSSGVHGLVYPGVVSEFFTLSEQERRSAVEAVLAAAGGRVPVVVGVSAPSTPLASTLATHAADIGAAGVMAMLPYVQHFFKPAEDDMHDYFGALAATGLPIVLQNARIGHAVPDSVLADLVTQQPAVRYLKEEGSPSTHRLTTTISAVGAKIDGVFAGLGGIHLINELDRGAVGSMPAPPVADLLVQAYERHRAGDRAAARTLISRLSGLFTLELLYNVAVIKEVLVRRGVIASTVCRAPAPKLDAVDHRELDEILDGLEITRW